MTYSLASTRLEASDVPGALCIASTTRPPTSLPTTSRAKKRNLTIPHRQHVSHMHLQLIPTRNDKVKRNPFGCRLAPAVRSLICVHGCSEIESAHAQSHRQPATTTTQCVQSKLQLRFLRTDNHMSLTALHLQAPAIITTRLSHPSHGYAHRCKRDTQTRQPMSITVSTLLLLSLTPALRPSFQNTRFLQLGPANQTVRNQFLRFFAPNAV